MELVVAYSSDNNYAQHLGVSMISLFENNIEFKNIRIYVIENNISEDSKKNLISICETYNRDIIFLDLNKFIDKLSLNIGNSISINSYARLFLASVVTNNIDKILYLDCDSIINNSLKVLWNLDISEYYIAGVKDTISNNSKLKVELDIESNYINAGMILINLKKWRADKVEEKFIKFIDMHNGKVFHHDQGTINGVLNEKCLVIHPKYNAMTVLFTMSREEIMSYYDLEQYYSEEEIEEAIENPVFIHYTPAFVNRPWIKGCLHPLADNYQKYLQMTPWKDEKLLGDNRRLAEKCVAFLYNKLPFKLANNICKLVFS